jgi:ATP-binding cassette subfamily F protein 3
MIARVSINHKSFGDKVLFDGLELALEDVEKIGIIGTNGCGKSTLFNMLLGRDKDYDGDIVIKKGITIASTSQEHHETPTQTVLGYITSGLPEYSKLAQEISSLAKTMGSSHHRIQKYSDALERFTGFGYFEIESSLLALIADYQLPEDILHRTFTSLSGGQKRIVELIKVQQSNAHLSLIDEPTNHMDYVAKEQFIDWMKQHSSCVTVITHDRDVLKAVDRIIELRDGKAFVYSGNYDDYLRTHSVRISSEVNEHEVIKRRMENLASDIVRFRRLKEKSRDPGTIKRFKNLEQKAKSELVELKEKDKPTFWIDKESVKNLSTKLSAAYDEHKSKTINIRSVKRENTNRRLMKIDSLSLGYTEPLFDKLSFELREGERLHVVGRNGRGKTTLIKSIIAAWSHQKIVPVVYSGAIDIEPGVVLGIYEQEISPGRIEMTLSNAISDTLRAHDKPVSDRHIRQLLSDYLFDPMSDFDRPVSVLSGGQKARLQLIDMMASEPNLLILDEPTNHLDLPSIEELESMLNSYHGAVLYISHDSYFSNNIAAKSISL